MDAGGTDFIEYPKKTFAWRMQDGDHGFAGGNLHLFFSDLFLSCHLS
jgi:hypothetical protein